MLYVKKYYSFRRVETFHGYSRRCETKLTIFHAYPESMLNLFSQKFSWGWVSGWWVRPSPHIPVLEGLLRTCRGVSMKLGWILFYGAIMPFLRQLLSLSLVLWPKRLSRTSCILVQRRYQGKNDVGQREGCFVLEVPRTCYCTLVNATAVVQFAISATIVAMTTYIVFHTRCQLV